jgi:hypothetical protein
VVAVILGGGATALLLASMGTGTGWVAAVLLGLVYPAVGLYQWSSLRKRGPEVHRAAAGLLGLLIAGQIGIIGLGASLASVYAQCVAALEAQPAIESTQQQPPGALVR